MLSIGYIDAGLMVVTLTMRTMIPLRAVGIVSSIFQIVFAMTAGITPMLIQHSIMLPMNVYRLYEQIRLVRKVREASAEDPSMDWLIPYMTRLQVRAGQILFHKGQSPDKMFVVISGRLRLSEIAKEVLPGSMVGELGMLAPNGQRTQTLRCIEDAEILQIDYDRVGALYFQNPSFRFYFLRLTSARLFQNIAGLEALLGEREREILRLQAANLAAA